MAEKQAYVTTDNDFQRYNVIPTGRELDKDRSNRFKYKENINAGYVNYNRALKGIHHTGRTSGREYQPGRHFNRP